MNRNSQSPERHISITFLVIMLMNILCYLVSCSASHQRTMIVHFRHRGLKRLFEEADPRTLPPDLVDRIRAMLARLHQAEVMEDLRVHSYRLHPLKGTRKGEWGITVRANWRITFRVEAGEAREVNLEDYH